MGGPECGKGRLLAGLEVLREELAGCAEGGSADVRDAGYFIEPARGAESAVAHDEAAVGAVGRYGDVFKAAAHGPAGLEREAVLREPGF